MLTAVELLDDKHIVLPEGRAGSLSSSGPVVPAAGREVVAEVDMLAGPPRAPARGGRSARQVGSAAGRAASSAPGHPRRGRSEPPAVIDRDPRDG